jgi:hypothetical protein
MNTIRNLFTFKGFTAIFIIINVWYEIFLISKPSPDILWFFLFGVVSVIQYLNFLYIVLYYNFNYLIKEETCIYCCEKVTNRLTTNEQRKNTKLSIFGAVRVWWLSGFGGLQPVVWNVLWEINLMRNYYKVDRVLYTHCDIKLS